MEDVGVKIVKLGVHYTLEGVDWMEIDRVHRTVVSGNMNIKLIEASTANKLATANKTGTIEEYISNIGKLISVESSLGKKTFTVSTDNNKSGLLRMSWEDFRDDVQPILTKYGYVSSYENVQVGMCEYENRLTVSWLDKDIQREDK